MVRVREGRRPKQTLGEAICHECVERYGHEGAVRKAAQLAGLTVDYISIINTAEEPVH